MRRTTILCPECMKKPLLTSGSEKHAHCDECGTPFTIVGPNTVKYKR